eukprot:scaffold17993_cov52-Phaeocystis_antarctica.AAC.4
MAQHHTASKGSRSQTCWVKKENEEPHAGAKRPSRQSSRAPSTRRRERRCARPARGTYASRRAVVTSVF